MRSLILLLLALSTVAPAAERKVFVSSFERLHVDGAFQVLVRTGGSPAGSIAGDPRQLDEVEVRQEGNTVTVRHVSGLADASVAGPVARPVVVTLTTPTLAAAYLVGSGAVSVAGMKGARVDLSVAGTGTIVVTGARTALLNATSIGTGRLTIAGTAASARFVVNGVGAILADMLDASEVTIRLDGPGEITARARYTANITSTGLGRVAVTGSPKCVVKAVSSGSVSCGAAR